MPAPSATPASGPPRQLVRRTLARTGGFAPPASGPWSALFESALPFGAWSRYDYLAPEPVATLVARGRAATLTFDDGTVRRGDTFVLIDALTTGTPRPAGADDLPWPGGLAGFLAYDLGRAIERLPAIAADDLRLPDLALGVFDAIAIRDRDAACVTLAASGWPREGRAALYLAEERLDRLEGAIAAHAPDGNGAEPFEATDDSPRRTLAQDLTRAAYGSRLARLQRAIADGDIYQANLAHRFTLRPAPDPSRLYARLCTASPAPFAAAVRTPDAIILSASPELFLRRRGSTAVTRPIKGTRPRGAEPAADAALAAALLASAKDRAEHVMIVDVERNDLGRVARPGGVDVPELAALESFPAVHHLTSTVRADLLPLLPTSALLRATFPGGSITGAPKIRAMELIEECEPVRRGAYTGAIGWFAWGGDCDLAMAIRTLVLARGAAHLWVGGGIVADSVAEDEYEETLVKGRSLARALGAALEGGVEGELAAGAARV